ncbi:restriction endonuclease subunit S [Desertibaculum subflavum]|uniref:restriction endonuclease subunit S n=1 Tax=Desertibaculum subflavum TaxID=2268458 RepID=UPI000E667D82
MSVRSGSLRYFAKIKNGSTPASGEPAYWDGDIAWATPDDLGRLAGNFISETKRSITPLAVAENNLNVVPPDTILLSTRAPIGHMAIATSPMAFNQGCRALIPQAETHGPYLFYLLRSRVPELNASANGTTFVELSRDDLACVRISLPSLDIQKRISAFLDERTARIDALIAKKQALLARLTEKRQAIATRAITKGLDPAVPMKDSGLAWLGQIPAHWEVRSLRYAVENLNRMRVPIAAELRKGVERLYPYYGASGIIDYVDEFLFDFPTVLVAEDGANLLSRSTPLAFSASGQYWVNNHAHILRPIDLTIWFCTSQLALYPLDPYISGSAQPKLTKDNLMSLPVWIPPLEEQVQIQANVGTHLDALDLVVENCRISVERLVEYRSALITAAVMGQIEA